MKYIVNADDFGRTETVNKAIIESFEFGYVSNASIMVNMPFYEQAVLLAKEKNVMQHIGLHINLTSGKPLTVDICNCSRFVNENGIFSSRIFKDKKMMFFLNKREKKAVAAEVDAQIEMFLKSGFVLRHADSHGHVHTFLALQKVVLRELKKYGFVSVRLSRNIGISNSFHKRLYKQFINRNFKVLRACTDYFGSMLDVWKESGKLNAKDGVTEIMLHPNYLNGQWDFGEPFSAKEIPQYITENMISFSDLIKMNEDLF